MNIKKQFAFLIFGLLALFPKLVFAAGVCSKPAFLANPKSIYSFIFLSGLASGLNPCVFAVILMIIGYSLIMGKKKLTDVIKIGITFIISLFTIYFLISLLLYTFIEKLISLPQYLIFYQIVRYGFIGILLFMAIVNFKEFIFPKKGFGFRIPKRIIDRLIHLLDKSSIPMTMLLALLTGLFALPCSLSICFGMINLLPANIQKISLIFDMLLFSLAFILPMSVIFTLVILGAEELMVWKEKQEKYDRWLRLFSGIILLAFAVLLFII